MAILLFAKETEFAAQPVDERDRLHDRFVAEAMAAKEAAGVRSDVNDGSQSSP